MPLLAIVIPMYNEEGGAERVVRDVADVLSRDLPDGRLFAVDDGSRDRTLEILNRLSREALPLSVVVHPENRGYGAAVLSGAMAALEAGYEFGLFMDSDLTNDPALIPRYAEIVASQSWDLVKASRYVAGGGMKGVPIGRRIPTILGNQLARLLFGLGVRDCTNGFRAVRLSLLEGLAFEERGFPSILEELYHLKRRGARATELAYTLTARSQAQGRSSFVYSFDTIFRYLKWAVRAAFVRHGRDLTEIRARGR